MAESIGAGNCDGLSIELHSEIPPDAAEADRLTIEIRIPFDVLRKTTADGGKAVWALCETDGPPVTRRQRPRSSSS